RSSARRRCGPRAAWRLLQRATWAIQARGRRAWIVHSTHLPTGPDGRLCPGHNDKLIQGNVLGTGRVGWPKWVRGLREERVRGTILAGQVGPTSGRAGYAVGRTSDRTGDVGECGRPGSPGGLAAGTGVGAGAPASQPP